MKFGGSYFGGEVQTQGVGSAVFSTNTVGNFKMAEPLGGGR